MQFARFKIVAMFRMVVCVSVVGAPVPKSMELERLFMMRVSVAREEKLEETSTNKSENIYKDI